MCKEVKIRILISCSLKATRAVCVRETEKEREREWCVCVKEMIKRERASPEQSWVSPTTEL